jgi:hypothetical protein
LDFFAKLMIKNTSLGLIFYLGAISLGRFYVMIPDGSRRVDLTHSIVTGGSLLATYGPVKYAPLQSLLMAPFYAMGYYFGALGDEPTQNLHKIGELFVIYLFLPIIISTLCVFYFRILRKMGMDDNTSLISAFLLFCATFFLPYAGGIFSEPLNAVLLLISFYYFYSAPTANYISSNRKNFFCLSLLILNNFIFVLYSGLMITYVFWASRVKRKNPSEAWRMVLEGSLILVVSVILFLSYNYYRYGEILSFGYEGEGFTSNWMVGMYGLLFSFGKGLLVFSPLTVLCISYFFFMGHEMESWKQYAFGTSLISFFCYWLVYSTWSSWHGGWCWGPRFLLPFVPLIHLMLPDLLKSMPSFSKLFRTGFFLAIVWAVGMNLLYYLDSKEVIPQYYRDTLTATAEQVMGTMFFPKETVVSHILENKIVPMKVFRFMAGLGLLASLLWFWKNRFLPRLSASQPSPQEIS